jgi:calcineurin-like phosphoesterase family protein
MIKVLYEKEDDGSVCEALGVEDIESADPYISSDYHLFESEDEKQNHDAEPVDCDEASKICKLHQSVVRLHDPFMYLGDITESYNYMTYITAVMKNLNGNKILIKGERDISADAVYAAMGFGYVCSSIETEHFVFSHVPVLYVPKGKINIHGHLHDSRANWKINKANHLNITWELNGGPHRLSEYLDRFKSGYYNEHTEPTDI